jgi:K+-sensing histidine kinase KdpD
MVPMMRGERTLGLIAVTRADPTPFPDQLVELLKTFADQAVIAIENARLFEAEQARKRELQESLQFQTATAEVLSVISRSPNQLLPVLDAITLTAARLCQADYAHFRLLRDGAYHVASSSNYDPVTLQRLAPIPPGPGSITGRVALERKTVHLPDILVDATGDYSRRYEEVARTGLGVPLLKDQTVVGVIMLFRKTVRSFTERQIALVNTFAEQALIAMENSRLFEEVQARTRELTEALEQQTATADVLKVISRSTLDLQRLMRSLSPRRACAMRMTQRSFRCLAVACGPVLLNLVGNAIKTTDAGEVRVAAMATQSHFTVTVADTGPGIPEAHQARIFEEFHQVDSSNTKAKGGTGLGLAIAKQILDMHGGRIWVASTLGQGSTFQMELPIRPELRKAAS